MDNAIQRFCAVMQLFCFPLQQYPHITVAQETSNGRTKEVMITNKVESLHVLLLCTCSSMIVVFSLHEVIIMQIWTPFHEEFDIEERARRRHQANSVQIYANVQFFFSDTV